MNKKKYIVVTATSATSLEDRVLAWMNAGYQPLGGVSADYAGGLCTLHQAMVLNYTPTAKDYENASAKAQG